MERSGRPRTNHDRANEIYDFPIWYGQGAAIFRREGMVIAVAHFALMKSPRRFGDDSYIDMMDSGTQTSYEFASLLAQHFSSIAGIFKAGRSVVEFHRLELLPDPSLRGLGVQLGWQLMSTLEKTIGAAVFILEPFPLQFAQLEAGEAVRHEPLFVSATSKLSQFYATAWGAIPMGDGHMLCSPRNRFERDASSGKWSFAGRKS